MKNKNTIKKLLNDILSTDKQGKENGVEVFPKKKTRQKKDSQLVSLVNRNLEDVSQNHSLSLLEIVSFGQVLL